MRQNKQPNASNLKIDHARVPVPRKTTTTGPDYVARRLSPVVDGMRINSLNTALMVPAGQVQLERLDSYDWKRELSDFLHAYGRQRLSNFAAKTSEETLRNRTDILFSTFTDIMKDKRLKTLSQIKPRMLPRMFELWTDKGVSKRAQLNYYTAVRWFWRVCGITIEPIAHFAKVKGEFTINRNADRDKSWTGNGVDFEKVHQEMMALDPVGARILLVMKTYGLRLKEALCLRPHEADSHDALLITRGTKTGRPRQLIFSEFEDQRFRSVLDDMKDQVPEDCHLAWSNRSLKQAKKYMYYLCAKVGLQRDGKLGVIPHGLRAEFAIDKLEQLTGQLAPVRGGIVIDYRQISEARRKVSRALGHNRPKITGAYYGSLLSMERQQLRSFSMSWERIERAMQEVGPMLRSSEVENLYWIGARAVGASSASEPYEFVFPPGTDDAVVLRLAPQICELVLGATGTDCMVHNWKSLPGAKQTQWEADAIPVFRAVRPIEYMQARLQEQKAARMKPSPTNPGAAG